jgi:hypothetical protein
MTKNTLVPIGVIVVLGSLAFWLGGELTSLRVGTERNSAAIEQNVTSIEKLIEKIDRNFAGIVRLQGASGLPPVGGGS